MSSHDALPPILDTVEIQKLVRTGERTSPVFQLGLTSLILFVEPYRRQSCPKTREGLLQQNYLIASHNLESFKKQATSVIQNGGQKSTKHKLLIKIK